MICQCTLFFAHDFVVVEYTVLRHSVNMFFHILLSAYFNENCEFMFINFGILSILYIDEIGLVLIIIS